MNNKRISEHCDHREEERVRLGMMNSHRWKMDPKVLLFTMARYKFVAKMLAGTKDVVEVGSGDGFATAIVAREVGHVRGLDIDPALVEEAEAYCVNPNISFVVHDLMAGPLTPTADAVYLLDVLEHIEKFEEETFLRNVTASIRPDGVCIAGIPSLESQAYASKPSRATHVNCMTGADFQNTMQKYFKHVFLFSMNDEVVHTGFSKMAHYLFCLCVGVK